VPPKQRRDPSLKFEPLSIGVTSTATVGPKLDCPSVILLSAAAPSSTTADGSFSADCALANAAQRNRDPMKETV
jgi:hypothetical protein